jgi:DNA-directed RNA polymerase specialized sigma24 family protein
MNKDWVLTQESFDALLAWLDPDRAQAGMKYEEIRRRLIKIFVCRGCGEPEDLADECINRVVKKLRDIEDTFNGDPALYFYGVANKVHLEYVRRRPIPPCPPPITDAEDLEKEYACLEKCMRKLPHENRALLLEYYQEERRAKIDHRKHLAERLGIGLNALRIRAYRIRSVLQECVKNCVQESAA